MIQANELRIGNWVEEEILGKVKVDCIDTGVIGVEVTNMKVTKELEQVRYNINSENLNPIPLTPDILEKCGFEKCVPHKLFEPFWKINKWFELWKVGGDHSKYQLALSGKMMPCLPEYLHQLQTLYFCLTGQELTVKL